MNWQDALDHYKRAYDLDATLEHQQASVFADGVWNVLADGALGRGSIAALKDILKNGIQIEPLFGRTWITLIRDNA